MNDIELKDTIIKNKFHYWWNEIIVATEQLNALENADVVCNDHCIVIGRKNGDSVFNPKLISGITGFDVTDSLKQKMMENLLKRIEEAKSEANKFTITEGV